MGYSRPTDAFAICANFAARDGSGPRMLVMEKAGLATAGTTDFGSGTTGGRSAAMGCWRTSGGALSNLATRRASVRALIPSRTFLLEIRFATSRSISALTATRIARSFSRSSMRNSR